MLETRSCLVGERSRELAIQLRVCNEMNRWITADGRLETTIGETARV